MDGKFTIHTIDFETYSEFEKRLTNAHFFLSSTWLKLHSTYSGKILLKGVFFNEKIVGCFPLFQTKSKFFKHYSLPPLTPYFGAIIHKTKLDKDIYNTIDNYFSSLKYSTFYYAYPSKLSHLVGKHNNNFQITENTSYEINLNNTIEELYKSLRQDKKRSLKKTQNSNYTVSFEKSNLILRDLLESTYARQSMEIKWLPYINYILDEINDCFQVTVYRDGHPASSLLFVYDQNKVYYLIGGFDPKMNDYSAGPLAMWEAILHSKSIRKGIFDFEGSNNTSIANYFRSFGSSKIEYVSITKESKFYKYVKKLL